MRAGVTQVFETVDLLDPRTGVLVIGLPGALLVALSVVFWALARATGLPDTYAVGTLALAFGYVACGVGFVSTYVYARRFGGP